MNLAASLTGVTVSLALLLSTAPVATAHPVPKNSHDRTIVVRLQKGDAPNRIRVRIEYRLEVDESTVVLNDMRDFRDVADPFDYRSEPLKYYARFAEIYESILAERLLAEVNHKPIAPLRCVSHNERLQDDDGKSLGHLRCDFVFQGGFDIDPAKTTLFSFHDQTYLSAGIAPEPGQIILSLVNETGLPIARKIVPNEALRKRAMDYPDPETEELLRKVSIDVVPDAEPFKTVDPTPTDTPQAREPSQPHEDRFSLLRLILDTNYGFWLTMVLAFFFGAAHALTPGHGKTLVAAYLVGERGTIWHASFLGLVTTLTHTGVVLILAVVMTVLPADMQQQFQKWIQSGLGLVMGLIVTCMGFWLFLQRISGRADHIHLDGGHHHHGPAPSARSLSWWGLVVLGVTGGLIPCWDAVGVLCITVGKGEFWLVLPAVLAFSAGLAVVLVLIGILVVQVPRMAQSRWGSDRLVGWLPIISSVLVTAMGLWLCFEGAHAK